MLHVGGAAGGHDAGMDRFMEGFERLSERARARLVIENDDRTYALAHVLELHRRTGAAASSGTSSTTTATTPTAIPDREALELALGTWPDGVHAEDPLLVAEDRGQEERKKVGRRVERSLVLPQLRAHADMIDPIGVRALPARDRRRARLRRDARGEGEGPGAAAAARAARGAGPSVPVRAA